MILAFLERGAATDPWRTARSVVAALAFEWQHASFFAQLGVVVILLGTVGDALAHVVQPYPPQGFTVPQQTAHLVILLGMVLTVLGVVLPGRRAARSRHEVSHSKEVQRVPRGR